MMTVTSIPRTDSVLSVRKHIVLGVLALVIAAALTVSIHFYGAHDLQVFFLMIAGYLGLLANSGFDQFNEGLFTVVNWFFLPLAF